MTREEAIEHINNLRDIGSDEALDMAIEALQREEAEEKGWCHRIRPKNVEVVVRCKDFRHADECLKSVQYARNENDTIMLGYAQIEWCSRGEGEHKGGEDE